MGLKERGIRTQVVPCVYTGILPPNPPSVIAFSTNVRNFPSFESISSENPKRKRYGNVAHFSASLKEVAGPVTWVGNGATHSVDRPLGFLPLPSIPEIGCDWSSLSSEAMTVMKPSLSSGFSLTNFIYELSEFKDLFSLWKKTSKFYQNVANQHLNYSFGWKPFIKDVVEMYDLVDSYKRRLELYKKYQNTPLKRHFSKRIVDTTTSYRLDRDANRYVIATVKVKATYTATLRYRYTLEGLGGYAENFKALMDTLGIKLSPSILWNAIPFSFVVDWFVNVGDTLQQFDQDFINSQVIIDDFCHSLKVTQEIEYKAYENYADTPFSYVVAAETRKAYTRYRAIPSTDLFGVSLSHNYGTRQLLLSASLICAK